MLTKYYNNNQRFIQSHLDADIIKKTKIFEKAEIRWVCVDDLLKMKSQYRHFFVPTIEIIVEQQEEIRKFLRSCQQTKRKTRRLDE